MLPSATLDQPLIGRSLEPTEHCNFSRGLRASPRTKYNQWFDADTGADRYNYLYSEAELAGWKDKIVRIAGKAGGHVCSDQQSLEARLE